MAGDTSTARARWELENNIQAEPVDALFKYDHQEQQLVQQQKPWSKDPHHFKQCVWPQSPRNSTTLVIVRTCLACELVACLAQRAHVSPGPAQDRYARPIWGEPGGESSSCSLFTLIEPGVAIGRAPDTTRAACCMLHGRAWMGCWKQKKQRYTREVLCKPCQHGRCRACIHAACCA